MPELTRIHPTAIVDAGADVAPGVVIGPYCLVGPAVAIGQGSEIGAHVVLEGRVRLGERCRVGHGALIGGAPQDFKYREGLSVGVSIGDDTVIREYVTVHRATHDGHDTRIGSRCLVMVSSHVAHDCVVGDEVIIINYAGLTGHVTVEDRATIGGLTGIHPFTRIGAYAYVGGCSKVTQDVPPFVMADGVPAVARAVNVIGMRRGGVDGVGGDEGHQAGAGQDNAAADEIGSQFVHGAAHAFLGGLVADAEHLAHFASGLAFEIAQQQRVALALV